MTEKSSKEKTLNSHYAELHRFGQNGEYERALKTANKILGIAPQEALAFQYKIICLIHLSKFDEAISLLNKQPQFLQSLIFEKAYCYYRANKPEDALSVINESNNEIDYRVKELKAQILYRLERFQESAEIYQEIIKNTDDEYQDEHYTNLSATTVYLSPQQIEKDIDTFKDDTYELCFNKACMLIEMENYLEAEKKLKLCEKLCREALEEDETPDDEIEIELALIRIQLGYVYQKQGRVKESHQLYTSNLKAKLDDIALVAVASNNIVCINKDQNVFDSKKKMKAALNEALIFKLPSKQRKVIALNNTIFNYYINQTEQCEKFCKLVTENWPDLSINTQVIKALLLVKADKTDLAIKMLEESCTENDRLYIKLCIAQLHLMQGDRAEACKILENLGQDSFKPAIVGALTSLYLSASDEPAALKVFEKTVDFYKKHKVNSVDLTNLWKQAAEFHIKKGLPHVAANSLEELYVNNQDDKKIVAQLVLACSQFDQKKALSLGKELPSVEELSKGVDLENLQTVFVNLTTYIKKGATPKQDSLPSTPGEDSVKRSKTKKHKKRKGKLPKNYDPNIAPDPERWLPKYERTGYRKKRDRRVKDVIKGSQGTASGQADQYDFSKYVDDNGGDSPTTDPSPRTGKGQTQKKTTQQQKRKNKRR